MRIRSVALRTNNITGNIKLRMKTILRNLLSVLRRFKMATLLNVLGLSVAFSAFILIMMQVEYDQNFDRGYTDTESIFRVEAMFEDGGQAVICRPLADAFIQSSPHIVAGTLANPWGGDLFFSVEENGVRNTFKEQCINVYLNSRRYLTLNFVKEIRRRYRSQTLFCCRRAWLRSFWESIGCRQAIEV